MNKPKVISIVGPTASGKSGLAITLAKAFAGEVISADSRQVYRGLDIGSGKVTEEEMDDIPHHLLSIVDPMTIYTGADFSRDAHEAIDGILSRDHRPIIVGGTFFYIELLRGTMQAAPVPPDPLFRATLETLTNEDLLGLLHTEDPRRASTIDPDNRRRLIRSLEIIKTLGAVPEVTTSPSAYEWLTIGIELTKEALHHNIHQRLLSRLDEGMVTEVETLKQHGVTDARLAEFGLEYKYINEYLNGTLTKNEMTTILETKIKQFAKRQLTWLKRDKSIIWCRTDNHEAIHDVVTTFLSKETS